MNVAVYRLKAIRLFFSLNINYVELQPQVTTQYSMVGGPAEYGSNNSFGMLCRVTCRCTLAEQSLQNAAARQHD